MSNVPTAIQDNSPATYTQGAVVKPELVNKFIEAMSRKALKLAHGVMQNYPNYRTPWIRCTNWSEYNVPDAKTYTLYFETLDGINDDDKYYPRQASPEDVVPAVLKLYMLVEAGELYLDMDGSDFWDDGNWDAICLDILMQIHFYGELVYS